MALSSNALLSMYRKMLLLRRFEEKVSEVYRAGMIPGFVHTYIGQEAVAAGTCEHLTEIDRVTSTHRGHGHALAVGVSPRAVMAELWGRRTGCSRGRGGSMHLFSPEDGLLGATGIVGAGIPIAVGSAYAAKYLHEHRGDPLAITLCFFGDGASNTASFHEGLNLAAAFELPVVFICENNLYATEMAYSRASKNPDIAKRADGYGMPGMIADGMDIEEVYEKAGEAIERARGGGGPTLIECKTYRYHEHYEGQAVGSPYRSAEETASWKAKDPIERCAKRLRGSGISEQTLQEVEEEVDALVQDAVEYAEKSPWPQPEEASPSLVFSEPIC